MHKAALALGLLLLPALSGCLGKEPTRTPPSDLAITLELLADGFETPVGVFQPPGGGDLYVLEQVGRVIRLHDGGRSTWLDVRDIVRSGGEQGLLGLAFHPGFAENGRYVIHYTNLDGDTRLAEGRATRESAGEPDRELFAMGQPYANHNGGTVTFGPDGRLYLGLGDGGGAGDPRGHAQSKDIRLGKVLRFDVDSFPSGPAVPAAGNPFYERGGDRAIWVYGVRNPWRFSFDRATGDLWVADVGQNEWEEVNVLRSGRQAGANLGWDKFEGRQRFEQGDAPGHVPPVHVYSHAGGRCSVTGGFVYRGSAIPGLAGQYVFGDYCSGEVWALDAARPREAHLLLRVDDRLASFGEDAAGELYVVGHGGSVHRLVAAD